MLAITKSPARSKPTMQMANQEFEAIFFFSPGKSLEQSPGVSGGGLRCTATRWVSPSSFCACNEMHCLGNRLEQKSLKTQPSRKKTALEASILESKRDLSGYESSVITT